MRARTMAAREVAVAGFSVEDEGDTLVLHGDLDVASTPVLEAVLAGRTSDGDGAHLTLDLSDVPFVDSSAIRVMIQLARSVAPGTLRLRGPQPVVRQVFDLTSLAEIANIELV